MNKRKIKKFFPPIAIRFLADGYYLLKSFIDVPRFLSQYRKFKKLTRGKSSMSVNFRDLNPRLGEATAAFDFDHHYIYHPAWAARVIAQTKPEAHTDISSLLSFSTIVSAFVPVKFYDYRPAKLSLSNMESGRADLLNLPFADNSVRSLSCMHTVEHIGLGRYGDPLDPAGDVKAMKELQRVLAPGGNLLFVVPVGREKIMFNAHRIYSYRTIINQFSQLELKEFSLITDSSYGQDFIINATEQQANEQIYGCGCFWFEKPEK